MRKMDILFESFKIPSSAPVRIASLKGAPLALLLQTPESESEKHSEKLLKNLL